MNIKIKKLSEDAVIPKYAKIGDSGFDLVAIENLYIIPGETVKIRTGLAFEIPGGLELQIRPRSGITSNTKLRVQLGTIDSGYRGEVHIIIDNISPIDQHVDKIIKNIKGEVLKGDIDSYYGGSYIINKGDRIAQGVIAAVGYTEFIEDDELNDSERGENGFGSSGIN